MFIKQNLNPKHWNRVGDCVVRALAKVLEQTWDQTYIELCIIGLQMKDMPSSNAVWSSYLKDKGFRRYSLPNTCPNCYTVKYFADDHTEGEYVVATGSHVVAVIDGCFYDSWYSGDEVVSYYFVRER